MQRRSFLIYSLLFIAGCSVAFAPGDSPPLPKPEKLRLSVSDVVGAEALERDYETFRAALEQVLEIPIEFLPVQSLFEATSALELDRVARKRFLW